MNPAQRGFTLVEIAIVLVIIGLLLGGVLKGQELITQARIRNVANDLGNLASAIYSYQDRYRKLPGDDDQAETRWTSPATKKGDGNGALGVNGVKALLNCGDDAKDGENCRLWQHLRLSGFIAGDAASPLPPQNAAGGTIQAQQGAFGLGGIVLCSSSLSGKIANAVDAQFDDGKPGTGQVRASNDPTKLDTRLADDAAYADDGTLYVLCKPI